VDHGRVESTEPFERFRRAVFAEPGLQLRLRSIPDWPGFVAATVAAAAERGIELTADEVLAARRASRRSWLERWV
jgi:hypothetical protein